jgi:light-regulated signal transduction histidine kinase (bacteriophytochrome)
MAQGDGEPGAARLLRGMHKVFSHDLPNQMVVLQSLLQLLQMEEAERLSADGREYVERLTSAARKAGSMVRFLKDMSRLHAYQPQRQEVALPGVARELCAELNQLCPDRNVEYAWDWRVASVRVDHRTFYQAILALLRERVEAAGPRCKLEGRSRMTQAGSQLHFRVEPARPRPAPTGGEQRLETVLARELLRTGGAELSLEAADGSHFSILVPG